MTNTGNTVQAILRTFWGICLKAMYPHATIRAAHAALESERIQPTPINRVEARSIRLKIGLLHSINSETERTMHTAKNPPNGPGLLNVPVTTYSG